LPGMTGSLELSDSDLIVSLQAIGKPYALWRGGDDDSIMDVICEDFGGAANKVFAGCGTEIKRYRRPVVMRFAFVEPTGSGDPDMSFIDAFVMPCGPANLDGFVVFVSTPLVRSLLQLFMILEAGREKTIRGLSKSEEQALVPVVLSRMYGALLFIAFHELSHVLRSHLPFVFGPRYSQGRNSLALAEVGAVHLGLGAVSSTTGQAVEIDADLLALALLIEAQVNETLRGSLEGAMDLAGSSHFLGESLFVLFRALEMWRDPNASLDERWHPHPDLRQLFVEAWSKARTLDDRSEEFYVAACQLHQGMSDAADRFFDPAWPILPVYSFVDATGRAARIAEYDRVRSELYENVRPNLLNLQVP
jgi:hypothetical protein